MQPIFFKSMRFFFVQASPWLFLLIVWCENPTLASQPQDKKKPEAKPIIPNLSQSTLEVPGKSIKAKALPGEKPDKATNVITLGDSILKVNPEEIRFLSDSSQVPKWTAKVPKGLELILCESDEQTLYFLGATSYNKVESPPRLRRLAISSGHWMEDLPVSSTAKANQTARIMYVSSTKQGLAILSGIFEVDDSRNRDQLIEYVVTFFDSGAAKPKWTQSFPSAGKEFSPGAFLLAPGRSPQMGHSHLQSLVVLEKEILVCAGPVQDLLCLEKKTGKVSWKLERIWEFERGFIGPSVWSHFMKRAGESPFEEAAKPQPKIKPAADPEIYGSIIGGPIVVEQNRESEDTEKVIYLAVSRGKGPFPNYLSECQVYEIRSGRVQGVVTLPRLVRGGKYKVSDGGLVWACQNGSMVRFPVAEIERPTFWGGPGGHDCIVEIEWFSQARFPKKRVWMTTERVADFTTFADGIAALVPSGGYVPQPTSQVFHFPLAVARLNSGQFQYLEIKVPFEGSMPEPETNYSSFPWDDGKTAWKTLTPYQLAITGLEISKNRLKVRFGTESWVQVLEFPLDEIPGFQKR